MVKHVIPILVCAAFLSACASGGQGSPAVAKPPPTMAGLMSQADAAVLAGQADKAYEILKGAGKAFPTEKAPWLRMAQMRYDSNSYGEAIVNALEALSRDPDDTLANSIAAVSGLRVSSKALADLAQKNNLSGSVRNEAQDLAKLLRTSLGEDVLVPTLHTARKDGGKRAAAPAQKPSTSANDPFGALK